MDELRRKYVHGAKRVVVKIGSRVLSSERGLHSRRIGRLVRELAALHDQGKKLVVVSSGAIASGISRLGLARRPTDLPQEQALAAVGQIRLMALYENSFGGYGKHVAQVLLTHEDLADRKRYLNAKHTLKTLLDWNIIPIVNENDTVAVEEMRFGDNDQLSALVATLMEMDLLVILSDVDGVFDRDPRSSADARLMAGGRRHRRRQAGGPGHGAVGAGPGGHALEALRRRPGQPRRHPHGHRQRKGAGSPERPVRRQPGVGHPGVAGGEPPHQPQALDPVQPQALGRGRGGQRRLRRGDGQGQEPVALGGPGHPGLFRGAGECVRCVDGNGREFARGLVNYSSQELHKIKGSHSGKIEAILGYKAYDEIIHRDDLVLL